MKSCLRCIIDNFFIKIKFFNINGVLGPNNHLPLFFNRKSQVKVLIAIQLHPYPDVGSDILEF
jgi:hypothetical protein